MKFHHTGVAVDNIQNAIDTYRMLGPVQLKTARVVDQLQDGANLQIISFLGRSYELVSGPVVEGLRKKNVSMYHDCFEVPDIESAILDMREAGFSLVRSVRPAKLFNGRKVCFLYRESVGLIELLEEGN